MLSFAVNPQQNLLDLLFELLWRPARLDLQARPAFPVVLGKDDPHALP